MKLKQAVVALALIIALGLLAYQSHLAWAKDEDVLTIEGPISVSGTTVNIHGVTLHVDDGTLITINDNQFTDNDPTITDLAAFVRRNPGVNAVGEYWMIDGIGIATSINVDSSKEVVGSLDVNLDLMQIRVASTRLPVSDDVTAVWIGDSDDYSLADLRDYVRAHPDTGCSATYIQDGSDIVTTEIDIDSDSVTSGAAVLNFPQNLATVNDISMRMTPDDTAIFIDDADATFDDLIRLWAHTQDLKVTAYFYVDDTGTVADELDFDTTKTLYGPISVNPTGGTVTISGVTLPVDNDYTDLWANDDYDDLDELADFVGRNPGINAYAYYYDTDPPLVEYIDVLSEFELIEPIQVDVASSQITIEDRVLPITADTSITINDYDSTPAQLAAFVQRNPTTSADVSWDVDGGVIDLYDITIDSEGWNEGTLKPGDSGTVVLNDGWDNYTYRVTPDTVVKLNFADVTLAQLLAYAQQNDNVQVEVYFHQDQGLVADTIDIFDRHEASGALSVDLAGNAVVIDGTRLPISSDTTVELNYDASTLQDIAGYIQQGLALKAYAYYFTAPDTFVQNLEVYGDLSGTTTTTTIAPARRPALARRHSGHSHAKRAAHRARRMQAHRAPAGKRHRVKRHWASRKRGRPQVDLPGVLLSVNAQSRTVTYQPRGQAKPVTLKVHRNTILKLNAARLPFSQFALTVPGNSNLWIEAVYSSRTHVARTIWCEQRLQEGVGQVVGVSAPRAASSGKPNAHPDLTLNVAVATRAGRVSTVPMRMFGHALVLKGTHLIRPTQIKPGYQIRFDGFQETGRYYLPRVLVLPPKKKGSR